MVLGEVLITVLVVFFVIWVLANVVAYIQRKNGKKNWFFVLADQWAAEKEGEKKEEDQTKKAKGGK